MTEVVDRQRSPDASGPAWSRTVFQELPADLAVFGTRCGAARPGGAIVASMRIPTVFGEPGGDLRCGNSPAPTGTRCRVTGVRVVRWGFLGPQARTATFVGFDGRRGSTQRPTAETGGAYLFAEMVDPAPVRAARAFDRALRRRIDARFPRRDGRGPLIGEAARSTGAWRARNAYVGEVYRGARARFRELWRDQQGEAVDATFAGGITRRVAGRGARGGPLPGVPPAGAVAPTVPAGPGGDRPGGSWPVRATYRGAHRAVEVRFTSPVALGDAPGAYRITVRGPVGRSCRRVDSSSVDWSRETRAGAPILVRIRPVGSSLGPGWCPGRRFAVRVRLVVADPRRTRPRSDQPVGRTSFLTG